MNVIGTEQALRERDDAELAERLELGPVVGIEPLGDSLLYRARGAPEVQELVAVAGFPIHVVHPEPESVDRDPGVDSRRPHRFDRFVHVGVVEFTGMAERDGEIERADEHEPQFGDREDVVDVLDRFAGFDGRADERLRVLGGDVVVGQAVRRYGHRARSPLTNRYWRRYEEVSATLLAEHPSPVYRAYNGNPRVRYRHAIPVQPGFPQAERTDRVIIPGVERTADTVGWGVAGC